MDATRPLLPFLSLAERDRRHAAIRVEMEKRGLDALVFPANHARWEQMMADARYVTGIGGFGTETLAVLPASGDVTAYVFNRSAWWKSAQSWVADVRDGRNEWAANVIERLSELGIRKGRIGLSGLAGLSRAPDGLFAYETVRKITAAFPGVELVDATRTMLDLRAVKSAEEVEAMRESMRIVETMIATMIATAKIGVGERAVYGAMLNTLVAEGGETPSLLIFGSGPTIGHGSFVPGSRTLAANDLIVNEIEGRWAGYSAQAVNPVVLGTPAPAYKDALDISLACFHGLAESLKPGVRLSEVIRRYAEIVAREGGGRYRYQFPLMNARGLGDESPTVSESLKPDGDSDVALAEGMVFVLKPGVRKIDDGRVARIGESVVVTPKGGQRLGRRPLGLTRAG